MTSDTQTDNGQFTFDAGPPMVTAARSGAQLTLDVASATLCLMAERFPKQYKECVGDALIGDV